MLNGESISFTGASIRDPLTRTLHPLIEPLVREILEAIVAAVLGFCTPDAALSATRPVAYDGEVEIASTAAVRRSRKQGDARQTGRNRGPMPIATTHCPRFSHKPGDYFVHSRTPY